MSMWFLFRGVSSSSWCLVWAVLFYCGAPWAFDIITVLCMIDFNILHYTIICMDSNYLSWLVVQAQIRICIILKSISFLHFYCFLKYKYQRKKLLEKQTGPIKNRSDS